MPKTSGLDTQSHYCEGTHNGGVLHVLPFTAAAIDAVAPCGTPLMRTTASAVEHQFLVPVVYHPRGPALKV